jgi:FkbM family methyltransferase
MPNPARKVARRVKHMLTRDISDSLDSLEQRIGGMDEAIRHTQLDINHNQTTILNRINDHVKNSGTLVLSESLMLTKIFSGLKIYTDPRDVAVAPHLALDTIWEHQITSAWLAVVKPTDTVIDIGANFGYFGALAAQNSDKKHSKVVFFEANPHLIPYLKKTLAVNWLNEQSVIENLAVADKAGTVTLNLLEDYIGSSSIQTAEQLDAYMHDKMYLETKEKIDVKAVSLDDYCKTHGISTIDLIKMDIEGYEEIAYRGMRKIIKASPNATIFIEFTKEGYEDPKGFYAQLLKDFGNVYLITEDGYIEKSKDTTYETVIGASDDWVMPIFSKNPNLATRTRGN